MPWERIAENKIREAMEDGEFDHLPGTGKPIDLDDYFKLPADLRVAYSLLKSANCVPAEIELLNEIAALERQLSTAAAEQQPALQRTLTSRRAELSILLERARRSSPCS
jgi:DnaJ-like protein